jgi:hypothetical protein
MAGWELWFDLAWIVDVYGRARVWERWNAQMVRLGLTSVTHHTGGESECERDFCILCAVSSSSKWTFMKVANGFQRRKDINE